LIVGGESLGARSSAEIYDPQTRQSSYIARPERERSGHSATLLADGSVLVTGGRASNGELQSSSEIYAPAIKRWKVSAERARPRADHVVTCLRDGRVMISGGEYLTRRPGMQENYPVH
jgi:hypothetical protein